MTDGQPQQQNQQQKQAQNQAQQIPQAQIPGRAQKWYERPWYTNPISLGILTLAGAFGAGAIHMFATAPRDEEDVEQRCIRQEWHQDGSSIMKLTDGTQLKMDAVASHELHALVREMETVERNYKDSRLGKDGTYPQELLEQIIKKLDYNKDGRITLDEIKKAKKVLGFSD